MSERAAEYFEDQEKAEKLSRLKAVCAQIHTNGRLKMALLNIDADERKSVYNCMVPHLPFKPLSYRKLMRLSWRVN